MTYDEMVEFIKENPHIKISHELFSEDEYIYTKPNDSRVYDENGYLFEDWMSAGPERHDGLRIRSTGIFESRWSVKGVIDISSNPCFEPVCYLDLNKLKSVLDK